MSGVETGQSRFPKSKSFYECIAYNNPRREPLFKYILYPAYFRLVLLLALLILVLFISLSVGGIVSKVIDKIRVKIIIIEIINGVIKIIDGINKIKIVHKIIISINKINFVKYLLHNCLDFVYKYYHFIAIAAVVILLSLFLTKIFKFLKFLNKALDNWLKLRIEMWQSPVVKGVSKVYYYTPKNISVKVLESVYFGDEIGQIAESLYMSVASIMAIFDYCYRYPVLATLRFWIEVPMIIFCIVLRTKSNSIIFSFLISFSTLLFVFMFVLKAWFFIRLLYKLLYQFRIIEIHNEIIKFETHPYVLDFLYDFLMSGDLKLRDVMLNVWRIIFPFLPHSGG